MVEARNDASSMAFFKTHLKVQMKTPCMYIEQQKKKLKITSSSYITIKQNRGQTEHSYTNHETVKIKTLSEPLNNLAN